MSFDPHSLKRLQELGRTLPESLPTPTESLKAKQVSTSKLHPIETEQNPEELFKQLIDASPNGEIPPHLIERLKNIELQNSKTSSHNEKGPEFNSSNKSKFKNHKGKKIKSTSQNDSLYISFKSLLLEEED